VEQNEKARARSFGKSNSDGRNHLRRQNGNSSGSTGLRISGAPYNSRPDRPKNGLGPQTTFSDYVPRHETPGMAPFGKENYSRTVDRPDASERPGICKTLRVSADLDILGLQLSSSRVLRLLEHCQVLELLNSTFQNRHFLGKHLAAEFRVTNWPHAGCRCTGRCFKPVKHFRKGHAERIGHLHNAAKADVLFAPLQMSHIGPMNPTNIRELFLGPPALCAQFTNPDAETEQ